MWGLTKSFRLSLVVHEVQSVVDVVEFLFVALLHHLQILGTVVVEQVEIQLINVENLLQHVFVDLREVSGRDGMGWGGVRRERVKIRSRLKFILSSTDFNGLNSFLLSFVNDGITQNGWKFKKLKKISRKIFCVLQMGLIHQILFMSLMNNLNI